MNATGRRRHGGGSRSRSLLIAAAVLIAIMAIQMATSIVGAVVAQRQAQAAAQDTFSYLGDLTAERVARHAATAQELVAASARSLEAAAEEMTLAAVIDMVQVKLDRAPQVRAVYVGFPDGSFVSVSHADGGFVSQQVEVDPAHAATLIHYDAQFNPIATEHITLDYDPRLRPWYIAGERSLGTVWTEPYLFFGSNATVASVSQGARENDELEAVVGADLDLSTMAVVLDSLPLGEGANAFLLSPDRRVIAAPSAFHDQLLEVSRATNTVPLAAAIGVEPAAIARDYSDGNVFGESGGRITLERGFPPADRMNWILHLETDKSSLSPGLDQLQVTIYLITAFSALGVIAVGIVMYRMWTPLRRLSQRARTDQLTGLLNRHEYRSRGATMLRRAQTRGDTVVFIAFDMDHFKSLNDALGHDAGDAALTIVGDSLLTASRAGDVVARLGGDEFVMMQVIADSSHGGEVVERVRSVVERTVQTQAPGGERIGLTAGYALTEEGQFDLDTLMAQADAALLEGKRAARGETYRYARHGAVADATDDEREG